ncbi:N-acetylmuramoyl-L-alanine amidase [Virgibacillus byunsanensis]|uniref:N-acetylmuramoyl-L-alanine amidase n=1 Tax=Virgibacillus byunsanensis TaxID=570945 RepID=A0ABW3LJK9_9BACI
MQTKQVLIYLLGALLVILTISSVVSADDALVNTDNLNVRKGPGTEYEQIGQVHTDESYTILHKQGNWVEIQYEDNNTGWITTEYITINEKNNSSSSTESNETISISTDNTHIRKGPSTDSDISHYVNKGTELDVISKDGNWIEVTNKDVSGYILKRLVEKDTEAASTGLKNKTIVIDPGHGGRDVGAIGATETLEKDFTYKTSMELKQKLTNLGAEVVMTRTEDEFVSLASRTSLANVLQTDAFISIHYNSTPELPQVTGIGTYYYHEQNEGLANYIQTEIVKETNAKDRGVTNGDFHVIRQTFKPSVLLELGFISNQEKEKLLFTNGYQKKLVTGMVNGLEKYFMNK